MDRKMIRTPLYTYGYRDDAIDMPLERAIEWLGELLAKVPPAFRSEARFFVELERGYYAEGDTLKFDIFYDRDETDEEFAARAAAKEAEERALAARREAEDRRAYEALNARFG